MDVDQIKIGKFIASKRRELGLLQKDIAEKLMISEKTVSKWECGNGLPEVIYMEPLCDILGITINELLSGEAIPIMDMLKKIDRVRLELARQLEFEQLKMRIYKLYGIEIESMEISETGAGSLTYFVKEGKNKYVVKYPSDNEINNPEVELKVCEILLEKGIPVCRFIKNKSGNILSTDESGRRFSVQHFYYGITYGYNEAPASLQTESAKMLAGIHNAMKDIEGIPVGIGADFIKYSSPKKTFESYEVTWKKAIDMGDIEIAKYIRSNMSIIERMPEFDFDINKFSCGNTHGDYMISQLIWDEKKISGVIDWTCACKHPYVWEIVRSYVFMAPEIATGTVDIKSLIKYMDTYLETFRLNSYDIENAGNFFYYFLSVCNYYGQYYDSISRNRHVYLEQAQMASRLLVWFDKNINELNEALALLSAREKAKDKIQNFYDKDGKLMLYPSKRFMRDAVLQRIVQCFEYEKKYTEKEVNEIIKQNISFSDVELIRRELFQKKLLGRLRDGSAYWRE